MPRAKSKLSSNKQSDDNELEFFSHEPDRLDEMVEGNPISENNPQVRGGRTGSRAVALQALYESDSSGPPALATVKRLAKEQELTIDDIDFASRLVNMCENQREHLDSLISKIASQYPSEQMPLVERNILRVAIAELDMSDAAPESVIANEAVELARLFGSNSSPKFINGVLGALLG